MRINFGIMALLSGPFFILISKCYQKKKTLSLFVLFDQGYRYYAGIGVASNCESALTYYRRVSNKGML